MISAPRTNPPRCTCRTCDVCVDELAAWVDVLGTEPRPGDEWRAVNLQRPPAVEHHQPKNVGRDVDVLAFVLDMADLTRRARWGSTNRQGRQP